jgi:hypothetical protein
MNNTAMKITNDQVTTPANDDATKFDVDNFITTVNNLALKSVTGMLEIAKNTADAKSNMLIEDWNDLFTKDGTANRLPFEKTKALKYAKIGECVELYDEKLAGKIPNSFSSTYEIVQIYKKIMKNSKSTEMFYQLFDDSKISSKSTQNDIVALKKSLFESVNTPKASEPSIEQKTKTDEPSVTQDTNEAAENFDYSEESDDVEASDTPKASTVSNQCCNRKCPFRSKI